LTDYDRDWLSGVLDDRLTIYSHGGHLGYLYRKEVQQDIVNALQGTAGTGSDMLYARARPAPPTQPAESAQPAQPAAATQSGFVPAPQAAEPVVTPVAPTPVAAPAKDDTAKTLAPSPDVITEPDAVPLHGSDIMRQERATARRAAAEPTIAGDTNTAEAEELEEQAPAETDVVVIEETGSPAPFALGDMPEQPGEAASEASHDTSPTPPLEPPDDLGQRSDVIIEFRDE
jgi:hypothetical protein